MRNNQQIWLSYEEERDTPVRSLLDIVYCISQAFRWLRGMLWHAESDVNPLRPSLTS